ncbi:Cy156 [Cynomolgus cytomegalovirus]|uniref:Cy156 n=1 Tax=Cynomolgus cytomegalovirus TaxID=1919083 RepID=UPI00095056DC|nr:Cy156 [Cynomolgus cytomegalovirus]APT39701.1 Cy156 [Cynomolgus cytomegalovirus]WAQ80489.1 Cy156 [Cynomolgus cytomegalovirus]
MESRKRKPEDETHTEETGDPEEGTSGGPSTGPSPPKHPKKDMALQEAVNLLEKMLADEEKRLTQINLGDPLFEVTGDDTIKTLEEIIQEGDDVVGAHQLVVKQVKLRVQRNRRLADDIIKEQLTDTRKVFSDKIDKLEQGIQNSYLLLEKLKIPFKNMRCLLEVANEQFNDTPVPPQYKDKFMVCLKKIVEYAVNSSSNLEKFIMSKIKTKRGDIKDRVAYTCMKYTIMAMQGTGGPKAINNEEHAKLFLKQLSNYDDLKDANQAGVELIKQLDKEQKEVAFHVSSFDHLITTLGMALYKEGYHKNDEAMLGMHTPITMLSDQVRVLILYLIDEIIHAIHTNSNQSNDELIDGLKPKTRIVINEFHATLMMGTEKMKFYSLNELREIVNDKLNEDKFPVVSGLLPENVPGADIPLASVIIHSDTEDEEEQESETDEEQESEADEEEQETETGDEGAETQAEGTDETDIEGTESETQIGSEAQPEAAESETQVEQTEGETEVETPQETEEGEESEVEMTVIKYAKPHVKEEEGAGSSSKSLHPMQTRSKTDK